jgi:hypothetical protein
LLTATTQKTGSAIVESTDAEARTTRSAALCAAGRPTTEEFHTLDRCLDTAIAEAVTEHARLTAHDP